MKTAIYPGSFNPWHDGHEDVLDKALKIFEHITILQSINPDKPGPSDCVPKEHIYAKYSDRVSVMSFNGLAVEGVKLFDACALIRGLRNSQDFEYEKTMQYWNEDLGLVVPEVFFIADRKLTHISSSAIRMVEKSKGVK